MIARSARTRATNGLQRVRLLRAIDDLHRDDPTTCCDEAALAARLGWSLSDVHNALFDARLAGEVLGRAVNLSYVELADIRLTHRAQALVRSSRATISDDG
jgi:hypothetical protein